MLRARSVFAAKIETTPGTAESLTASDAVYDVYDLNPNDTAQKTVRPSQLSFEPLGSVSGAYVGQFSFKTDWVWDGSSTLPAMIDVLMPACGWVKSGSVFKPQVAIPGSSGVKTVTLNGYVDGVLKQLVGAAGDWTWYLPTGRPSYIEWVFTGIWSDVIDESLLNPTTPTAKPIRFNTTNSCSFDSVSIAATEQFVISSGNTVAMKYASNTASGFSHAFVANRLTTVRGNPESCLVATQNRYGMSRANTQAALAIEFLCNGTSKVGFAAPKASIQTIAPVARDGIECDDILWHCNKNASAENESMSITFTAST